jgi:hypothetical protein
MRPRARTSSREQGSDFDLVGVKRMACWSGSSTVGCISIQVAATLSVMSDSLSLQSSCSMLAYC